MKGERNINISEEILINVLGRYGVLRPEITFLRHNDNKTYKVTDSSKKTYLFRIHQPVTENLLELQHKKEGLSAELKLLHDISENTDLIVPIPVRNLYGDFITEISFIDQLINCSLTEWIDGRDLHNDDLSNPEFVHELGVSTSKLHKFLSNYKQIPQSIRPSYGKEKIEKMLEMIYFGVEINLFSQTEFNIVEQSLQLILSRFENIRQEDWGIIHGDLHMGNILLTGQGTCALIDFSLFGYGYYLMDVAMSALNSTAKTRTVFFTGYFGDVEVSDVTLTLVEGFMLMSVLGYYAFQMKNEGIHPWITERMPLLCVNRCLPFLNGYSILNQF